MTAVMWDQIRDTIGCSYRQFDTWAAAGLIHATGGNGNGYPRRLDPAEVTVLAAMADLVVAGLKPAAAAPLARQLAELGVASLGRFTILDRTGT